MESVQQPSQSTGAPPLMPKTLGRNDKRSIDNALCDHADVPLQPWCSYCWLGRIQINLAYCYNLLLAQLGRISGGQSRHAATVDHHSALRLSRHSRSNQTVSW